MNSEHNLSKKPTTASAAAGNQAKKNTGSILLGFAIGWSILVISGIISISIIYIVNTWYTAPQSQLSMIFSVVASFPVFAALVYALWTLMKGNARTALGVFTALFSLVAVALLLIAACFSLVK
jgi:hypothetical protein